MRTILAVSVITAGIGLAGASGALAFPANGVIGDAAAATDQLTPVQWGPGHWRWGSRGSHWRWGSRGTFGMAGHWRFGSRGGGHWRWGSRGWR